MRSSHCALLLALLVGPAAGGAQGDQPKQEIGIVEHLGNSLPLDAEVYDESGNLVTLGSLIDKPTVLTFVYFRCPGICTPLLTELSRMVDKIDLVPGTDYRILTLSFDHRDDPELAMDKKENYLDAMSRRVDPSAWRFLTSDSLTIRRITDAAGFYYKRDGNDWIHAGALIFLSPEGKVTRYVYGIQYLPFDVKMALVEASDGRVGPTITRVLAMCYAYDPASRTYAFNYLRVGLVGTLLLVGVFVLVFIVFPRRKKGEREGTHGQPS